MHGNLVKPPTHLGRPLGGIVRPGSAPVGPSGPLQQVYPVTDSFAAPFYSLTRNTRDGRGVVVPVTAPAGTFVTITHNLGRIVQGARALNNNQGQSPLPILQLGTGSRTQQTIWANTPLINCLVRVE